MEDCIVSVFVPESILHWPGVAGQSMDCTESSSLLYGYHNVGQCERAGTTVAQHTVVLINSKADKHDVTCHRHPASHKKLVGMITTMPQSSNYGTSGSTQNIWIQLTRNTESFLSSIEIGDKNVDFRCVNIIFFCQNEIWQSDSLLLNYSCKGTSPNTDPVSFLISKVKQECQTIQDLRICSRLFLYHILWTSIWFLRVILTVPFYFVRFQKILKTVFGYSSATLEQIDVRVKQLEEIERLLPSLIGGQVIARPEVFNMTTGNTSAPTSGSGASPSVKPQANNTTTYSSPGSSPCLVLGRLLCVVGVDLLLGALLLYWLLSRLSIDTLAAAFADITQHVSSSVLQLLGWLRGAPAGLKLNQPLTRALANFFSYHVGLWTLYLDIASGAVYGVCCGLVWSGLLGATVQVALLSDVLHCATLHLHCFYVYAARLHMVQVSLLGSQWRAFRGHKWNPLKQRVDSLPATASRPLSRVLTAVIFTLVVFLLPTTTVYYLVFLALRLVLYVSRAVLALLPWLLHHNPCYILLLHLLRSSKLRGEVHFRTVARAPTTISSCSSSAQTGSVRNLNKRCSGTTPFRGGTTTSRDGTTTSSTIHQPLLLVLSMRPCSLLVSLSELSSSPALPVLALPSASRLLDKLLYARRLL